MKDSPSPPPAPDPVATAGAQSQSNIATAIANARLNRVNQQTPWGSITYTQGPADANGVPTYSSQITLSPAQQQLLEQQQAMQLGKNQLASQFLGNVSSQPLDFSHLHAINDRGNMYAGAVNAVPPPHGNPIQMPAPMPQGATNAPDASNLDLNQFLQQLEQFFSSGSNSGNSTTPATPAAPAGHAGMNVNQGVAGNPLDTFLGDRSMHGSAGTMAVPLAAGYTTEGGDTVYGDGFSGPNDIRSQQIQQALAQHPGYTQVRNNNIGGPGEVIDPSKVIYDPVAGEIAPSGDFGHFGTSIGDWGPFALAAIPAVAIAAGAAGAAGGAAGGADAGAIGSGAIAPGMEAQAAMESSLLNAGIMPGTAEWSAAMAGTGLDATAGMGLQGSAPVVQGSTPLAGTNQPSMWQQMMTNFQNGRGLLGLSSGQRAAVGLLPTLLRNMQTRNQQTGGH